MGVKNNSANYHVGERVSFDGNLCTVRYIGDVAQTTGPWLGVEWDDPTRGKHSGTHKGKEYFKCRSKHETAGSFVRPSRPFDEPISITTAVRRKYAYDDLIDDVAATSISGKQVEEVGFDKIRRQLAELSALRIVVLDGMCISTSDGIGDVCPNIKELDLSRNLLEDIGTVLEIISQLPKLKTLKLDGNRLRGDFAAGLQASSFALQSLSLDSTLMTWKEMTTFASVFRELAYLSASSNELEELPDIGGLPSSITELRIEQNDLQTIEALSSFLHLAHLNTLSLKGNKIKSTSMSKSALPCLETVDLSYNDICEWQDLDHLASSFPGMTSLRVSYNPLYRGPTTDEDFLETAARLGNLTTLNYSQINAKDRQTAETFYLSKIGRELSAVAEDRESSVLARHQRYSYLCKLHGAPVIKRQEATTVRPDSLAAGLLRCSLELDENVPLGSNASSRSIVRNIPASFTVYNLLGLIGKQFGVLQPGLLEVVVAEQILTQESRPLSMLIDGTSANIHVRWNQDRVQQYMRSKALINAT